MAYSEYNERSTITDLGLKVLLASSAIMSTGIMLAVYIQADRNGEDTTELLWALALVLVMEVVLFFLIFFSLMIIDGSHEGIQVRYRPFMIRNRVFLWKEVSAWQIRKVSPFGEFGGWGLRRSFRKKKTGLITGGGKALELQLQSGHTWVVSTGNPEMLAMFCRKYAADKEVQV